MGEPIIIWPPDGGNFTDYGDADTSTCQAALDNYMVDDCSAQVFEALNEDGLACCFVGE